MTFAELVAKISLDSKQFNSGLKSASSEVSDFASSMSSKLGGATKFVANAFKVVGAAVGAGAVAVTALAKQSVSSYAEYEQLIGGVKKLYGNMGQSLNDYASQNGGVTQEVIAQWQNLEKAQNDVLQNANKAYLTAGMSANDYITNVTGFSAALINSLGGDTIKAAELADTAMKDIADNANTFGKYTVNELAGVYQALARGNYQTLDNLQLGFAGTKTGMEALIKKANELAIAQGKSGDLQIDSYADIVQAIHLVQESMNITGTTQDEAAKTISGSLNMTKAAWDNLITGLANGNKDVGMLVDSVVEAASTFAENVIPVAETALTGIATLVEKVAPMIAEKLPSVIDTVLPSILSAATTLVTSLGTALISNIPLLVDVAVQMINDFVNYLIDNEAEMQTSATELTNALVDGLVQMIPSLATAAGLIVGGLVTYVINNLPQILNAGIQLLLGLATGLTIATAKAVMAIAKVVTAIWNAIKQRVSDFIDAGRQIVEGVKNGIAGAWQSVVSWFTSKVSGLVNGVKSILGIASPSKVFKQIGGFMAEGLGEGWDSEFDKIKSDIYDDMDFGSAQVDLSANNGIGAGRGVSVVQNIYSKAQTAADLMQEALYQQEKAVILGV